MSMGRLLAHWSLKELPEFAYQETRPVA